MAGFLVLPSGLILREEHIVAVLEHAIDWAHEDCTFFYHKDDTLDPLVLMEVGNKQVAVTREDRDFLRKTLGMQPAS